MVQGEPAAGYRIYRDGDLERLEQIVALKCPGMPQRRVLEEKRRLLDGVIGAVCEAERALEGGRQPNCRTTRNWMLKYCEKEWLDLFRDIEGAMGENPASARAVELADRWKRLVDAFTGGDPAVEAQVRALYVGSPTWPSEFKKTMAAFAKAGGVGVRSLSERDTRRNSLSCGVSGPLVRIEVPTDVEENSVYGKSL